MDPTAGTSSILEEDTSKSLAATLKLAKAKGYVEEKKEKRPPTSVVVGAKRVKLEAKGTVEEKREVNLRDRKRNNHRGARNAQLREIKEGEADVKFDIKLDYTDDAGRKLKTKEAFNYMSYRFHGKGPGRNKIDKRLRRQALETKMKQAMSTDVPSSAALMISKQKELQSPFIVLSKGSK